MSRNHYIVSIFFALFSFTALMGLIPMSTSATSISQQTVSELTQNPDVRYVLKGKVERIDNVIRGGTPYQSISFRVIDSLSGPFSSGELVHLYLPGGKLNNRIYRVAGNENLLRAGNDGAERTYIVWVTEYFNVLWQTYEVIKGENGQSLAIPHGDTASLLQSTGGGKSSMALSGLRVETEDSVITQIQRALN